jgi:uncharacterized protein (DUF4415 family)
MNENAMSNTSKTDWDRVDAMTDEDIDTSDIAPLSEEFFTKAKWRIPQSFVTVTVPIDPETFAWFQAQGETAQQQMAAALRIYAEAQKVSKGSMQKLTE